MEKGTCVFVTPHINQFGAEKSLVSLISHIKNLGNEVLVIMPEKGSIVELLDEKEIPYIVEKFAATVNYVDRPRLFIGIIKRLFNLYKALKVSKMLKKCHVRYVHTNSIVTDFGVLLSNILKCAHYQHIREFADLDFHMSFELGKKDLAMMQKSSKKIICISKAIEEHYSYLGKNLCTIYNGVALNRDSNIENKDVNESDNFRMVLTGRLGKEKGHYLVLDAIEYLKGLGMSNLTVDFYGSGSCEDDLKEHVNRRGLSNQVKFCGFVKSIPYHLYDAGLMCSDYEGFGRVTIEYMLAGLPVIGSNSGATPELVLHKKTGLLYKAFDYKSLAEAIRTLEQNRVLARDLGTEGMNLACLRFNEQRYLQEVTELLFAE